MMKGAKRRNIYSTFQKRMIEQGDKDEFFFLFFFLFDKTIDDETGIKASIVVTTGRQQPIIRSPFEC